MSYLEQLKGTMVAAKETAAKNLTAYFKTSDKQTPPPQKKKKEPK